MLDLEVKLANEWAKLPATGTKSLLSKVMAGFAKAGIFMIPQYCIDGYPVTDVPYYCPASSVPGEDGENGGDAVIDIDDNDTADDVPVLGVPHQEVDYLKRSGPAPTFLSGPVRDTGLAVD